MLFSFRSHYLFAIGLETIFNLRRSTPASLHSTLKLCDLWNKEGKRQGSGRHERDDSPLWWNFSERLFYRTHTNQPGPCTTIPRNPVLSIVDSRLGLMLTRFTRRYHGYNFCYIFLPLLICLSSGRSPALQRLLDVFGALFGFLSACSPRGLQSSAHEPKCINFTPHMDILCFLST